MIDFLLGVPGKLKTISDHLTTYWTSTRAAKLDLLTVAPAPASTALTNATWTDVRAGKLDTIVAESPAVKAPTIAINGTGSTSINGDVYEAADYVPGLIKDSTTATLTTKLSVTGSGVLEACFLAFPGAGSGGFTSQLVVIIDGVTVFNVSDSSVANMASWQVAAGCLTPVRYWTGSSEVKNWALSGYSHMPFKTSLVIQARHTNSAARLYYRYWRAT